MSAPRQRRARDRITRRPGRPAGGDAAVREALLDTARNLFLERGFASVSVRQIAAAAGSSPATIHYHFGDKLGLYRAMLEVAIAPVVDALQRLGDPSRVAQADLAGLVRLYMRMLATNPWVPRLIVQEVLAEGGRFREQFIEDFAGRFAPLFVAILGREQANGAVRGDLDPRLAALSAISLIVFPFVALPVATRAIGFPIDSVTVGQLAAHTTRVLFEGIGTVGRGP